MVEEENTSKDWMALGGWEEWWESEEVEEDGALGKGKGKEDPPEEEEECELVEDLSRLEVCEPNSIPCHVMGERYK